MDNQATIGTRLRELRECREKSCQGVVLDLQHRGMKISRELLNKWECDLRIPNGEAIVKLAEYYGTTTDYILGYSDVRQSVDRLQITHETLGFSLAATQNLIKISNLRGGRASELMSAILESPQLPALFAELVASQDGIDRQYHYIRPRENPDAPSALRPMPSSFTDISLDMAEMYILRASKKIDPLLREVLGYNELVEVMQNGEHQED